MTSISKVVEWCIDQAQRPGAGDRGRGLERDLARRSRSRKHAEKAGADAVLVVTPYYNKPTQEGMYQHFKAVNDAIGIPIIIYNIPPRSVVDMSVDTMKRLFELKNIAGVKDATGNLARVSTQREAMGDGFHPALGRGHDRARLSTPRAAMAAFRWSRMSRPRCARNCRTRRSRTIIAQALKVQDRLIPLHAAIFLEPGLAGAKCGLSLLGRGNEEVRLPLLPVTAGPRRRSARRWCMPDC